MKPRHAKPTIHGYCKKVLCANPAEKTNKPRAIQSTICSVRLCQLSSAQHRPFQFSTGSTDRLSLPVRPRKGMKRGQEPRIAWGVLGVLSSKSKGRTYNREPGICCHEHIVQILNLKEGPREGGCYHCI